jgi:hypothetical protein
MAGGHQGEDTSGVDVQGRLAADPDLPWKALLRTWRPNVPLITAAEGQAIAGGTELTGATEIRVAGESAKFGISEVRWSLYAMGGSVVRIPRQIPYTVAAELLLTGDHIDAQRALQLGLVGHVVPDGQALDQGAWRSPSASPPTAPSPSRRSCGPCERPTACRVRCPRSRVHLRLGRLRVRGRTRRAPAPSRRSEPPGSTGGSPPDGNELPRRAMAEIDHPRVLSAVISMSSSGVNIRAGVPLDCRCGLGRPPALRGTPPLRVDAQRVRNFSKQLWGDLRERGHPHRRV